MSRTVSSGKVMLRRRCSVDELLVMPSTIHTDDVYVKRLAAVERPDTVRVQFPEVHLSSERKVHFASRETLGASRGRRAGLPNVRLGRVVNADRATSNSARIENE